MISSDFDVQSFTITLRNLQIRRGPEGHISIKRFMSIPIFENDKVQIVFGVGNKNDPYDEDDVVQLQLIANELTKIRKQRQAENTLRESEKKY